MTDFTIQHFQQVADQAKANAGSVADGLKQCFEQKYTVEAGDLASLPTASERDALNEPGLLVGMRVGNTGIVVVIPESFPLPEWYREPNESQKARLGTIGMEWSMALLPEELMAEDFSSHPFDNLNSAIDLVTPDPEAQWIPLQATAEGGTPFTLYLVGPVSKPCLDPKEVAQKATQEAKKEAVLEGMAYSDPSGAMTEEERRTRMARVMKLKVDVSVRLAEKKIELSQLVAMAPGSLILFDKACEELLDMYVNNTPYCRGEVVKVGEHFGLKVNEVGFHMEREARII
ncbi:Flagellar motor switch protein FliN [Polystyrenella longa]|uniref:Flagellar motor switch protein FliN n=1 Tax=Polystyrenella longa TaxID=2528007 RepID=A0A518CJ26_9PLAN|nr:FliM/FliN family flagellar motor switch protein [Polystyrenella longa]QDU79228.1 Flagellar motor switch protein FliN [Polystyrenella longa]